MARKTKEVNKENKGYAEGENAPILNGETVENSASVQSRLEAREKAYKTDVEKGGSDFGPDQFPDNETAVVKARRERIAKTVGDASEETTGKTYGTTDDSNRPENL